jgi:transposase-like protein
MRRKSAPTRAEARYKTPQRDPRRIATKIITPEEKAQVVKRHVEGGENAEALAEEFEVSRASVYGWVTKYKKEILAKSRRAGMAPLDADRADKSELIAHIEALELENKQLRDRLIGMLLNTDPLLSLPSGTTAGRRKPRDR